MYLTTQNAHQYVGKTLDAKQHYFHYYPLTVHERDGKYFYSDRNGTWIPVPDEADRFNQVRFDFIVKD